MAWLQLAKKTAVVTGAGSGIGAAVARALSAEKCRVILADVNSKKLEAVVATLSNPKKCDIVECDVSNELQVKSLFQSYSLCKDRSERDSHEKIDILVNCAGITSDGWISKMTLDQWQKVQDVNLTGTFLCCREFLSQEHFQKKQQEDNDNKGGKGQAAVVSGGSIINVSSVVALMGNLAQVNYAASKGGVHSLTKALAKEVAHRNVRVNCIAPGFIKTEMTEAIPEKVKEAMISKIPLRKFGLPEDVANLILFLASCERSGYITGQTFECSGMIAL